MEPIPQQQQHTSPIKAADHSIPEYKTYKYRYVILLLYCLVTFIIGMMSSTTIPITTNLESIYGLNLYTVTFCNSLIWCLIYIPMNFVANYVLDQVGLRFGTLLGSFLAVAGLWLRLLNRASFYFIFGGQLLGSIAQPFITNAPQKLSATWFPPKHHAVSTAIGSILNLIGTDLASF